MTSIATLHDLLQRISKETDSDVISRLIKEDFPSAMQSYAGLNAFLPHEDMRVETEDRQVTLKIGDDDIALYEINDDGIVNGVRTWLILWSQLSFAFHKEQTASLSAFDAKRYLCLRCELDQDMSLQNWSYINESKSSKRLEDKENSNLNQRDIKYLLEKYALEATMVVERPDKGTRKDINDEVINFNKYPKSMSDQNKVNLYFQTIPNVNKYYSYINSFRDKYKKFWNDLKPKNWSSENTWNEYLNCLRQYSSDIKVKEAHNIYTNKYMHENIDFVHNSQNLDFKKKVDVSDVLFLFVDINYGEMDHEYLYVLDSSKRTIIRFNASDSWFISLIQNDDTFQQLFQYSNDNKATDDTVKYEISNLFSKKGRLDYGGIWRDYFAGYNLVHDLSIGNFQGEHDTCIPYTWYFASCYFFNVLNIQHHLKSNISVAKDTLLKLKLSPADISSFFINSLSLESTKRSQMTLS